MKGHVSKRGNTWAYWFDVDPDPLTGKRRQQTKSGFPTEKEAWKQCRTAMTEYEKGRLVRTSKRKIGEALPEWLARVEHSLIPSMAANWRNYIAYYVTPYVGKRAVQEVDGAVCDALYAKLLAEGRRKAQARAKPSEPPVHRRRVTPDGRELECRPYRYDGLRCYRNHPPGDPLRGQPITTRRRRRKAAGNDGTRAKLSPGLEPKTVVNVHRLLHRAWEDFTAWGWAKRNVVKDAHPPRVTRKGRKVWTVDQLRAFLDAARRDRFFALWVLEVTSGMRRCELAGARRDGLDLTAGTLTIEITRVVVDGSVIEEDGKSENAQRTITLDPFTLAVLTKHVAQLDEERREFSPDYEDHGLLFCWENGRPPHPDTITRRFGKLVTAAGLPPIRLHDVRHSYATAARDAKIDWKALSTRIGHADVAFTMKQYVQADLEADRQVATTLAKLILGGLFASKEMAVSAASGVDDDAA